MNDFFENEELLKLKEENEILRIQLKKLQEELEELRDKKKTEELKKLEEGTPTDEEKREFLKFLNYLQDAKKQVRISISSRPLGSLEAPRFRGSIVIDFTQEDLDTVLERIGTNYGPGEYFLTFTPTWRKGVDELNTFRLHKVIDIPGVSSEDKLAKINEDLKKEIEELKKKIDEEKGKKTEEMYSKMFETLTSFIAKVFPQAREVQTVNPAPPQPDMASQFKLFLDIFKEGMNLGLSSQGVPIGSSEEDTLSKITKIATPFLELLFRKPQTEAQLTSPTYAYSKYVLSELAKYLSLGYSTEICAKWLKQNLGVNQIHTFIMTPIQQLIEIEPNLKNYISQIEEIKQILKIRRVKPKELPSKKEPETLQNVEPKQEQESEGTIIRRRKSYFE